jgi:hypothetical protein
MSPEAASAPWREINAGRYDGRTRPWVGTGGLNERSATGASLVTSENAPENREALQAVLRALTELPASEMANARELVAAGELQLAVENLIVQLDELGVPASNGAIGKLRELARVLELRPMYFDLLDRLSESAR